MSSCRFLISESFLLEGHCPLQIPKGRFLSYELLRHALDFLPTFWR